jgi:hypothetical protein
MSDAAETLRYARGDGETIVQSGRGHDALLAPECWPLASKRALTRVARIAGPFTVETREGVMECEDGWLAVDSNGDPYPIAADVFEATYALVSAT